MFRLTSLLALASFSLTACQPGAVAPTSAVLDAPQDGMLELANGVCTIRYAPGLEADAQKFDGWLHAAKAALMQEFAAHEPELLAAAIKDCKVMVYAQPNEFAGEGMALVVSGVDPQTHDIQATIHFLAPSRHSGQTQTSVGEPMDDNYIYKTLVHEYGTLFLAGIADRHAGYRSFDNAFNWFEQGYEEYLGVMLSSEHSRTVTKNLYLREALTDPARIDFAFGLNVVNDYTDGVALMMFMHDAYGKEAVQSILASPEPTFARAMLATVGSLESFKTRFEAWRAETLSHLP